MSEPLQNSHSPISPLPRPSGPPPAYRPNETPRNLFVGPHFAPTPYPGDSAHSTQEENDLLLKAQEYQLPMAVKSVADSYIEISHTTALITALFTAVQITLAQIASTYLNRTNTGWKTLHWLIYAGIYVNTGTTAAALALIHDVGYLTISARSLLIKDRNSWPYRTAIAKERLPTVLLASSHIEQDFELMQNFGLRKNMKQMYHAISYGFYVGSFLIFASLAAWVCLTEILSVWTSLILVMLPAVWLSSSFFFTAEYVPWVPIRLCQSLWFGASTWIRCFWGAPSVIA
ncbi:hypothetical protein CPB86DRAFT_716058 [Serendipita vermifera]|nr:hypothetical protein CPB86DRAFT_716058 [Serendipita vermifera]